MKKEFIPYEQALALKELGFDEPCFGYHINESKELLILTSEKDINYLTGTSSKTFILAPTYSQAFRWFREKYHIHAEPFYKGGLTKQTSWYDYKIYSTIDWIDTNHKQQWKNYEEAELECLKKLIEIVKTK